MGDRIYIVRTISISFVNRVFPHFTHRLQYRSGKNVDVMLPGYVLTPYKCCRNLLATNVWCSTRCLNLSNSGTDCGCPTNVPSIQNTLPIGLERTRTV